MRRVDGALTAAGPLLVRRHQPTVMAIRTLPPATVTRTPHPLADQVIRRHGTE